MEKPFDEYVDQFTANVGPYGIVLNFLRSQPKPVAVGSQPLADEVGGLRMSMEHVKVMVYILKKLIHQVEEQLGVTVPVSYTVLNNLKIAPEDWESFWKPPLK